MSYHDRVRIIRAQITMKSALCHAALTQLHPQTLIVIAIRIRRWPEMTTVHSGIFRASNRLNIHLYPHFMQNIRINILIFHWFHSWYYLQSHSVFDSSSLLEIVKEIASNTQNEWCLMYVYMYPLVSIASRPGYRFKLTPVKLAVHDAGLTSDGK